MFRSFTSDSHGFNYSYGTFCKREVSVPISFKNPFDYIPNSSYFKAVSQLKNPIYGNRLNVSSSALKFYKCDSKKCLTCPTMSNNHISQIKSDSSVFCKVKNCIYKIKCLTCNLEYIGQTSTQLNLRINNHRSDIKKFVNKAVPEFVHFQKHSFEKIEIEILDVINNKESRLNYENIQILENKTIFPYGLNSIYNGLNYNQFENIYSFFKFNKPIKLISKRFKRGYGKSKINFNLDKFIEEVEQFTNDLNYVDKIKNLVFKLANKSCLKILQNFHLLKNTWNKFILFDLICFKLHFYSNYNKKFKSFSDLISYFKQTYFNNFDRGLQPTQSNRDISKIKNCENFNSLQNSFKKIYIPFTFCNKQYDTFNFRKIINKFAKLFPLKNVNLTPSFKYTKTLGSLCFNYRQVSNDLDNKNYKCVCNSDLYSKFIDPDFNHVITGKIEFLPYEELKSLLGFGTKYRYIHFYNKNLLIKIFKNDLYSFCVKISKSCDIPFEYFLEWYYNFLNFFTKFITKYQFKIDNKIKLNMQKIKIQITKIQENFVITPIDKANNNFAFICKKFYCDTLNNEIQNSQTYNIQTIPLKVIQKRIIAFSKRLNFNLDLIKFPFLFCTPKMHKSPLKFRFITNSRFCFNNKINKKFQSYLKIIFSEIKKEENWIINNSFCISEFLKTNKCTTINTFDFENLFTSIPLNSLKKVLIFYFNKYQFLFNFEVDFWNTLIDFCIFNNYVLNGNKICLQTVGIPQGTNFSNLLADLFLHFYESNYNFNNSFKAFRYIDDLCVLDFSNFENIASQVYPSELSLKKTNLSNTECNFLDLHIKIENEENYIDLYDKRNEFTFNTIFLSNWLSNISVKIHKNILISQIKRIYKYCNKKYIDKNLNRLVSVCLKNKYPTNFTSHYIKKLKFT